LTAVSAAKATPVEFDQQLQRAARAMFSNPTIGPLEDVQLGTLAAKRADFSGVSQGPDGRRTVLRGRVYSAVTGDSAMALAFAGSDFVYSDELPFFEQVAATVTMD
jgi:hypothetical protein